MCDQQYILTGIGAFAGALAAILCGLIIECLRKRCYETKQLKIYFYNLNFAVTNLQYFWTYIINEKSNLEKQQEQDKNPTIQLENAHFDFNEHKLDFICKHSPKLFDKILQLKTDLNNLYELGKYYNEHCNKKDLKLIERNIQELFFKLSQIIEYIDQYKMKHYKFGHSLMYENIKSNIKYIETNFNLVAKIKEWTIADDEL